MLLKARQRREKREPIKEGQDYLGKNTHRGNRGDKGRSERLQVGKHLNSEDMS